jgi:hypothetical protein
MVAAILAPIRKVLTVAGTALVAKSYVQAAHVGPVIYTISGPQLDGLWVRHLPFMRTASKG